MREAKQERSLDLYLEAIGRKEKVHQTARVIVVGSWGFTRDGGHAMVTADCASASALEHEIDRLHGELDDVRERGCKALGESAGTAANQRAARSSAKAAGRGAAIAREKPRLSIAWTVADMMTRDLKTVGPNDPIAAGKALMDAGGFRHLVVVSEEGEIEGVLSHRDLFFGPLAWSIGQGQTAYEKLLKSSRVKDVMQGDVRTIEATAPLQEAAAQMREGRIGCLPVVDGNRLVGLISEGDLVQLVADASR
jgi:CBS domain-containing protein